MESKKISQETFLILALSAIGIVLLGINLMHGNLFPKQAQAYFSPDMGYDYSAHDYSSDYGKFDKGSYGTSFTYDNYSYANQPQYIDPRTRKR